MAAAPDKKNGGTLQRRMFASLSAPLFRLYFLGTLAFFAAMSMQIVSMPLLIFYLTGKTEWLGIFSLVNAVPMLLVSTFGGAYADRLQKKRILIGGMVGSALITAIIATVLVTGALNKDDSGSWFILLALSIVQGVIMGVMMPALIAIIPELSSRDQLMNAMALNTTGMNTLNLVAPPIAGYIIADDNYQAVFYTTAALFLTAALVMCRLPARTRIIPAGGGILAEMAQGFRYILGHRLILLLLVFSTVFVALSMPYQQFIPVYVEKILHTGAAGSGILNGVCGGGALLGSLFLTAMPGRRRGLLLLGSGVLAGTALVAFSFSSVWAFSIVAIFFLGLAQPVRNTIGGVLLQTHTEDAYMGRVMSITNMQWGIMSLGTFFVGILAAVWPVQWVMGALAMGLIVISLLFIGLAPRIRTIA